jgi:choline kinase
VKKYTVIIPAAGQGKRLKPLTDKIPKSMVRVGNSTILEIQLNSLPDDKIKEIVFIVGHAKEIFIEYVNKLNLKHKYYFVHNKEYESTNCAYSLFQAKDFFNDGFIYFNSDLLLKRENILSIFNQESDNVAGARKNTSYTTDLQKLYVNGGAIEKWSLHLDGANAEVMGPIKLCADDAKQLLLFYNSLSENRKKELHCFSLFSERVENILFKPVYFSDGSWVEIDTPEDLQIASEMF